MKKKYKDFLRKAKDSPDYWANLFTLELTEDILKVMKNKKISQKKLSGLLGTSEAYVSKVLNGDENLSIKSITKLSLALGCVPHIHIAAKDTIVEWKERGSSQTRVEVRYESYPSQSTIFTRNFNIEKPEPYFAKNKIVEFTGSVSTVLENETEDALVVAN